MFLSKFCKKTYNFPKKLRQNFARTRDYTSRTDIFCMIASSDTFVLGHSVLIRAWSVLQLPAADFLTDYNVFCKNVRM